ncbi:type I-E CRISPR-associated protein Cse2/CasB [Streptomyces sp. N2A]|uniref:type I-E CRISPR-associated protein Cse2/CasB n=1 Tax=Streptomyces sp. N2A TaxID=3073936 RepID=UPI00286FFE4D|nr:type I-E CRISPR-associated protein Cse2/CasB [Streptomyces sp. N2A]
MPDTPALFDIDEPPTPPTTPPEDERTPTKKLSDWLTSLVRGHQNGTLADLRRPNARTVPGMIAASFAGPDATPEQRDVYRQVAFLFAVYHRGSTRDKAMPGIGTMGAACARIGTATGRGRKNDGAVRIMHRLLASSRRIPWRHLQHAVERLRSCDAAAPNWQQLTNDLTTWLTDPDPVADQWGADFFTPTYTSNKPKTTNGATK